MSPNLLKKSVVAFDLELHYFQAYLYPVLILNCHSALVTSSIKCSRLLYLTTFL